MTSDEHRIAPLRAHDPLTLGGFDLLGRLGEGGQGVVFLGRDADGRLAAVKLLHPWMTADPVARRRVADQLDLTRRLPSSIVVSLTAADLGGPLPYVVSPYVPGNSLAEHVRRHGPLPAEDWRRIALATVSALAAVHAEGVVHHDLKPANVLLGPDGPLLADFDIALRAGEIDPLADADDGVLGSAAFLAPERFDAGPAVPASDVFAWAATMVHAATGRSPFAAADTPAVVDAVLHRSPRLAGLPADLRPLLQECLAKDPAARPTAREVLARLRATAPPAVPTAHAPAADASVPVWGTPDGVGVAAPAVTSGPAWGTLLPGKAVPGGARGRAARRRAARRVGVLVVVLAGAALVWHLLPQRQATVVPDVPSITTAVTPTGST